MTDLLMPKATAVWLVDNTTLTFDQIAEFCGLHPLEVQAIADGEVAIGIVGQNPVIAGQLTDAEIKRCEEDAEARLKMSKRDLPEPMKRAKGPRYTPIARRQDKPDAIAWCLKFHPELSDAEISRLIGTTKPTITRVRERTHENIANIKPRSPAGLGLCTQMELDEIVAKARKRTGYVPPEEPEALPEEQPEIEPTVESVFGPSAGTAGGGSDSDADT